MSKVFLAAGLIIGYVWLGTDAIDDGICGPGAACLGLPSGCEKGTESTCDVLAKVTSKPTGVLVQLFSAVNKSMNLMCKDRWISVGFSETGEMDDSPVVSCFEDKGHATVKLTFNKEKGDINVGWVGIDQSQIQVTKSVLDNNGLTCEAVVKKLVLMQQPYKFDLTKKNSLILATGPMIEGAIGMHDFDPASTDTTKFGF